MLSRLPFHLTHNVVRTVTKNCAILEINHAGAICDDGEPNFLNFGVSDCGVNAKRNWWAAARKILRVARGGGVVVIGGVASDTADSLVFKVLINGGLHTYLCQASL
jgi:ribonuclease P/MRP protein subunit RPP1